jgi:hypothetical protein
MALTEAKYRTFDELMDSVRLDLYSWNLEGMLESQQLIKVAMRVSYDLGFKINQQKSSIVEIHKRKGKLPEGFDTMNYALCVEDRYTEEIPTYNKTYSEGILEGVVLAQNFLEPRFVNQAVIFTDIIYGNNVVIHNLQTMNVVIQVFNTDGSLLDFDVEIVDLNTIRIISESPDTIVNSKVVVLGAKINTVGTGSSCPAVLDCTSDGTPKIYYTTNGKRHSSKKLKPLTFVNSQSVSPECEVKKGPCNDYYDVYIKNGFIHTMFDEGILYINFQSIMEDDDGNLLVLDHPYTNEYYEYALKQRVFENLFMAGEPVQNHLQLMNQKLKEARTLALSFVNTPDFKEMKDVVEMNRKAMYNRYYRMFNH